MDKFTDIDARHGKRTNAGSYVCIDNKYYQTSCFVFVRGETRKDVHYRLTDCCKGFSGFTDNGDLYCKDCFELVTSGEGDGSEYLTPNQFKTKSKQLLNEWNETNEWYEHEQ